MSVALPLVMSLKRRERPILKGLVMAIHTRRHKIPPLRTFKTSEEKKIMKNEVYTSQKNMHSPVPIEIAK